MGQDAVHLCVPSPDRSNSAASEPCKQTGLDATPTPFPSHATDLGDKVIIFAFALRAAALLRRVLYIDWPTPCGLETYFAPACIDWRLPPSLVGACRTARVQKWFLSPEAGNMNNHSAHELLTSRLLQTSLAPANAPGCLRFYGNYRWPSTFSSRQYPTSDGTDSDLFHFLLRPTGAALRSRLSPLSVSLRLSPSLSLSPSLPLSLPLSLSPSLPSSVALLARSPVVVVISQLELGVNVALHGGELVHGHCPLGEIITTHAQKRRGGW